MSSATREGEARGGQRLAEEDETPRLVHSQLLRVRCSDRDREMQIPPHVWLRLCMELRLSAGAEHIRELLGGRYVIKAQLLKAKDVPKEMRAFDVVVSQSMGRVGESSFEFLYSIREVDNRSSDSAGKLLATALAVCVPVKQPGERMPISDSFRALAAQEAASRRVSAPDGDVAGEAYVKGDSTANGGEVTGMDTEGGPSPTAGQPADRLMLQQMLTLQSSNFDAPDVFDNSKLEVRDHIMTLPMVLRPSDEDWNHHINNTSFIRFFDDALCIMREAMTEARNLASATPSKAAFDYLAECNLGCTKCHILCKFYDGSEAEGVDDGMHAWNPDGLASIAMIFRGIDTGGQERVFARARYAFPKV